MEFNKIYNDDCFNILKTMPAKSIDIVIMDPPYGMEYYSNHYKNGNPFKPIHGDKEYPIDILSMCFNIAAYAVFSFMRWDNLYELSRKYPSFPKPKSFITWIKNNWTAGDLDHEYGRQWEGIAFWPMEKHKFYTRPSDVVDCRRVPHKELLHPTQKPEQVIDYLLRENEGTTVLDPFCGSGTTLVSAQKLGKKWIGIDTDKEYCAIAQKRIDDFNKQLNLF